MSELVEADTSSNVNESLLDEPEDMTTQTVLHSRWTFYYRKSGANMGKGKKFDEIVTKVGSFQTVEHFWRIYDHMTKPNELKSKSTVDYNMFKNDIAPVWEDPANKDGGRWIIRLKNGLASRYWEVLVLAIIGEQFDVGNEICGVVISVRYGEDRVAVWNKTADNTEAVNKIRDQLKRYLQLPSFAVMEYKHNNETGVVAEGGGSGLTAAPGLTTIATDGPAKAPHPHYRDYSPRGSTNNSTLFNNDNSNHHGGSHSNNHQHNHQHKSEWKQGGGSGFRHHNNQRDDAPASTGDPIKDKELADAAAAAKAASGHNSSSNTPSGSGGRSLSSWASTSEGNNTSSWGGGSSNRSPRGQGGNSGWMNRNQGQGGGGQRDTQQSPRTEQPGGGGVTASGGTAYEKKKPSFASDKADVWSRGNVYVAPVESTPAATSTTTD